MSLLLGTWLARWGEPATSGLEGRTDMTCLPA